MKYDLSIDGDVQNLNRKISLYIAGNKTIEITEAGKSRTTKQNSSAHLWFTHIADTFNDRGLDMQATLAKRVGLRWTPEAVKECLFKVLAKAMYGKESTTQLTTAEFSKVADMLADVIARDYGLNIEFPNKDNK